MLQIVQIDAKAVHNRAVCTVPLKDIGGSETLVDTWLTMAKT